MKNADQPAYPITSDVLCMPDAKGDQVPCDGLTKREYFAAMAMQGILSARYEANPVLHTPSPADAIQDAICYADELLEQLES